MLRLDKTISRKTTLHADHDAENRARWQVMSFAEKREVVLVLQQRRNMLHAWSEQGREQGQRKTTSEPTN